MDSRTILQALHYETFCFDYEETHYNLNKGD
jgi:hypothetical protein